MRTHYGDGRVFCLTALCVITDTIIVYLLNRAIFVKEIANYCCHTLYIGSALCFYGVVKGYASVCEVWVIRV